MCLMVQHMVNPGQGTMCSKPVCLLVWFLRCQKSQLVDGQAWVSCLLPFPYAVALWVGSSGVTCSLVIVDICFSSHLCRLSPHFELSLCICVLVIIVSSWITHHLAIVKYFFVSYSNTCPPVCLSVIESQPDFSVVVVYCCVFSSLDLQCRCAFDSEVCFFR